MNNQFGFDKILRHIDRIAEWQGTGLSRPITYELDMTNVCNSQCVFCFGFRDRQCDTSSLTLEEAKGIIAQIKDFGGKGLTFTGGGEPLCNRATVEAVRYAKEIGLDVGFITNAILLTEAAAEVIVDCCTWVRVSLDAGTKVTYEHVHRVDGKSFEKVLENISMLAEKKRQRKSNITIGTGFITFPEVKQDMIDFVTLSKSLGVDYAQFRPLLKKFYQQEINDAPDVDIVRIIRKCQRFSSNLFQVLHSVHKYECMKKGQVKRNYGTCFGHHFAAVIAANKKMYLCCHMRGLEKYCIGDLNRNALREIWRSKERQEAYRDIDFSDCPLLCRCDGFNTILWNMSQASMHENFL